MLIDIELVHLTHLHHLMQETLHLTQLQTYLKYYDGAAWQGIVAGSLTDIVQDGTPQLGGGLDLNGNDITGTGNINITGGVTMSGNLTVNGTTTTINSTTLL